MKNKFLLVLLIIVNIAFADLVKVLNQVENGYNFWLNVPSGYKNTGGNLPILLFLHGRSLCGNDLDKVKRYGIISEIMRNRKINAYVVAPQCPVGKGWEPDKVMDIITYIKNNYDTDNNRIYVIGMSLGGYGTLNFAGKYASEITAAVALCGGGDERDAENLNSIPLWIMHGRADKAVPFSESEKIVRAIRSCGGNLLRFSAYNSLGHGELGQCFMFDEIYDWLFIYSKDEKVSHLTDNIAIPESRFRVHASKHSKGKHAKEFAERKDKTGSKVRGKIAGKSAKKKHRA
jgi:predicted peptidase